MTLHEVPQTAIEKCREKELRLGKSAPNKPNPGIEALPHAPFPARDDRLRTTKRQPASPHESRSLIALGARRGLGSTTRARRALTFTAWICRLSMRSRPVVAADDVAEKPSRYQVRI